MSVIGAKPIYTGLNTEDHQPAYVFAPSVTELGGERPSKRRKVYKRTKSDTFREKNLEPIKFGRLLNGAEDIKHVWQRQQLFEQHWATTHSLIESILDAANESTLEEVTSFIQNLSTTESTEQVPVGFVVTGPNNASQVLLFKQLETKLKSQVNGPVIVLRSGDALNLKAVLKQLIRDATSQRAIKDWDEVLCLQRDGQKLLNYDLAILQNYVESHSYRYVVVTLQDSEAFDSSLLNDLIQLLSSWMDRIPFRILFGVATSVKLFQERLSRAATRHLCGSHFNVEKTSSIVERIFLKVVAGVRAPLRLGAGLLSSLMERQWDHGQSVQTFTAALKYAYMSHFHGNPLSILNGSPYPNLQREHLEAIRLLPSFKNKVNNFLNVKDAKRVREIIGIDNSLLSEIREALDCQKPFSTRLIQKLHVLSQASTSNLTIIDLYIAAFAGKLSHLDVTQDFLGFIRKITPEGLVSLIHRVLEAIQKGNPNLDLDGWEDEEIEFVGRLIPIHTHAMKLAHTASKTGEVIRSGYNIINQSVRTTVVSQKVQLNYEKSTLSEHDEELTGLIDRTIAIFQQYFTFGNPQQVFLNEVWLYDSQSPHKDVFTPKPRFAIERALSTPRDYLNCNCCNLSINGLSETQPATVILYQLYLETGSLINVYDLWSAFFTIIGGEDGQNCEERAALMLFYRALADLKSFSMVKSSKKKQDHMTKLSWKGL